MTSLPVGVIIQQVNGRLGAISNCGNNINLFKQKKKTQCPAVYLILRHVYDLFFSFFRGGCLLPRVPIQRVHLNFVRLFLMTQHTPVCQFKFLFAPIFVFFFIWSYQQEDRFPPLVFDWWIDYKKKKEPVCLFSEVESMTPRLYVQQQLWTKFSCAPACECLTVHAQERREENRTDKKMT